MALGRSVVSSQPNAARKSPTKLTSRSSLLDHTYPPFYACYLLKSLKTPRYQTTYVGSTPHPPRRLRQHNGDLTQGARKTQNKRPWVMTMIVYGFPSKLAALQFEWAWQHPERSRHMHQEADTASQGARRVIFPRSHTSNRLRTKILVVRTMLNTAPYNSWPLRVKLFFPEAVEEWINAAKTVPLMPEGFSYSIELEGVDGKSGEAGSGRNGPIDVMDIEFTSSHLEKHRQLGKLKTHKCAICNEPIEYSNVDPLTIAVCTGASCTSVSHLRCLSDSFISHSGPSSSRQKVMIPRGGSCPTCGEYNLWGDIVRGCYRRRKGGAGPILEEDELEDEGLDEDAESQVDTPKMTFSVTKSKSIKAAAKTKPKSKLADTASVKRRKGKKILRTTDSSGEEIYFPSDIIGDVTDTSSNSDHLQDMAQEPKSSQPKASAPKVQKPSSSAARGLKMDTKKLITVQRTTKVASSAKTTVKPKEKRSRKKVPSVLSEDEKFSFIPPPKLGRGKQVSPPPSIVATHPPTSFFSSDMLPAPIDPSHRKGVVKSTTPGRKRGRPKGSKRAPLFKTESGEEIQTPLDVLGDSSDAT